jgi:hypothetical protein
MAEDLLAGQQYKDALQIALQQQDSRLAPLAMQSSYNGKGTRMLEELGALTMQPFAAKRDPIRPVDTSWSARWTTPNYFDLALQLDRKEQAQALSDPRSVMVQAARAAVERQKDQCMKDAFFGTALTGANGTTAATWASEGANQIVTQAVGASAATRLNVKKLRAALKILKKNEVNRQYEPIYVGIDAEQSDALYEETVFISKEFSADAFVRNDKGIITSFMGFQFVELENLPNDGTYTQIPVWTPSAMDFGTWDTEITRVYEDMSLRGNPWTSYIYRAYSAARRDVKRIVEIKCKVSE